jgi:hypothetical protein
VQPAPCLPTCCHCPPAAQGPRCPLQSRLLFHIAHKSGDEAQLMQQHGQLGDGIEDQLGLAAVHFERGQVQVGPLACLPACLGNGQASCW